MILDLHVPGRGRVNIETIGMGELLGWSWLFPPYKWAFGAVAASPIEAFEFDARAVRSRCAADPVLGYEVTRRVARVLSKRLQSTRGQADHRLHPACGHALSLPAARAVLPLHIEAERREEEKREEMGYLRREVRYGSFSRSLPLPEGVTEADITASCKDGVLEIRIPEPKHEEAKKIAISKS